MLDRLVQAGLLEKWSCAEERLELTWCGAFLGRESGDHWFQRFALVLGALSVEQGLSELEQATLMDLAVMAVARPEKE